MKNFYLFAFWSLFILSSQELYGGKHKGENGEEKNKRTQVKKLIKKNDPKKSAAMRLQLDKLKRAKQEVVAHNKATGFSSPSASTTLVSTNFMEEVEERPSSAVSAIQGPTLLFARRLASEEDHTEFLIQTIRSAKYSIMISSYNISPNKLLRVGVGQSIIEAADRGVSIYIYYRNLPRFSKKDYAQLCEVASRCKRFEENANHSKCLIADETVTIGSNNWLSDPFEGSYNGTLSIFGELAPSIIDKVWDGMKFYQNLKYENHGSVNNFMTNSVAFLPEETLFAPGQSLFTLRTPESHGVFLTDVLARAQRRVLLFSPFIRLKKLKSTLSYQMLQDLQQRNVALMLTTSPNPCDRTPGEQGGIFSYLDTLRKDFPNFSYTTHTNFHAKTLIADGEKGDINALICEGSLNWLSAVEDIDHGANNFEMSVAVRGDIAHSLIQNFENTDFGKFVISQSRKEELTRSPQVKAEGKKKPFRKFQKSKSHSGSNSKEKSLSSNNKSNRLPPKSFDRVVTIFSGESFKKSGFCARFTKGDYLRDGNERIVYFKTPEEAKQTAYDVWKRK